MRTKWIALTLLLTFFVTLTATEATADIRRDRPVSIKRRLRNLRGWWQRR
jgi:hypothetical protein